MNRSFNLQVRVICPEIKGKKWILKYCSCVLIHAQKIITILIWLWGLDSSKYGQTAYNELQDNFAAS